MSWRPCHVQKADNGIRMHENIAVVHMVANASGHKIGKNQFNSVACELLFVCLLSVCAHGNDANEKIRSIAFEFTRLSVFLLLKILPFGVLVALGREEKGPAIYRWSDRRGNFNEIKVSGSNYSWL